MLSLQTAPRAAYLKLTLLPPQSLVTTGPVDHADWNIKPVLGNVIRLRYQMLSKLMEDRHFSDLLEVGYGSGIFKPFIAQRSENLHGIDIQEHRIAVAQKLSEFAVAAHVITGTGTQLPNDDASFDAVLAVSTLEFIDDLPRACSEINRVLKPGGLLFAVTPGRSKVVNLGLALLSGEKAENDFGDRRSRIILALLLHFELLQRLDPRFIMKISELIGKSAAIQLGRLF